MAAVMLSTCVTLEVAETYEEVLELMDSPHPVMELHAPDGESLSLRADHVVAASAAAAALAPLAISPTQPAPPPETEHKRGD